MFNLFPTPDQTSNLVELATSSGLTTLVSLIEAAGLAETIATTGKTIIIERQPNSLITLVSLYRSF